MRIVAPGPTSIGTSSSSSSIVTGALWSRRLDADNFDEVRTDDETEVDGRSARRISGFDDVHSADPFPACGVRIEVESHVAQLLAPRLPHDG
jgi:hypothetical protein